MKTVYAIKQISEHDVTNTEMHTTRISKVETRIVGVYNDKNNAMIDAVRFMNLTAESMKNSKHAKESIDYTKMTSAFSLLKNKRAGALSSALTRFCVIASRIYMICFFARKQTA